MASEVAMLAFWSNRLKVSRRLVCQQISTATSLVKNDLMLNFIKQLLGIPTRTPLDKELVAKGTIIDVRSTLEYNNSHLHGSQNIPLDQIGQHLEKIRKMPRPIITCCKSGMRSSMAAQQLRKAGIEVHNGGSWRQVADILK